MFCDVVHAKSTHFNISASVQVDLPKGKNFRGVSPIWVKCEPFLVKSLLVLICVQLQGIRTKSGHGGQEKKAILVILSKLQNAIWAKWSVSYPSEQPHLDTRVSHFWNKLLITSSKFAIQALGVRKKVSPGCLFLEVLCGKVHLLENVEMWINKSCWQWSFHCSMPDFFNASTVTPTNSIYAMRWMHWRRYWSILHATCSSCPGAWQEWACQGLEMGLGKPKLQAGRQHLLVTGTHTKPAELS